MYTVRHEVPCSMSEAVTRPVWSQVSLMKPSLLQLYLGVTCGVSRCAVSEASPARAEV